MITRCDWIKKLPPGEYDIKALREFTGLLSNPSLKTVMLRYGAKVKSVRVGESNRFKDVFVWRGVPKYLKGKANMPSKIRQLFTCVLCNAKVMTEGDKIIKLDQDFLCGKCENRG